MKYTDIEKTQAEKAEIVKRKLKELEEKRRQFIELGKKAFDQSGTQEMSSALSTVFKDGFALANKIISEIQKQSNELNIKKLQEKDRLLVEFVEELAKKGKLDNEFKEKMKNTSETASKAVDILEDELGKEDNKALVEATNVVAKYVEEAKQTVDEDSNVENIADETQDAMQNESEEVKLDYKQKHTQQQRVRKQQRAR